MMKVFLVTRNFRSLMIVLNALCHEMSEQGLTFARLPDWAADYVLALQALLGKAETGSLLSEEKAELAIILALQARPTN
jgi:hypothetical protein